MIRPLSVSPDRTGTPRPFFQTEPAAEHRRLLLVSYHFPPGQSAGALRWQKLSRYAAERGWGVDVVTLHPSSLPSPDRSRLEELPPGVRVFGVPAPTLAVQRWEEVVWKGYRRLFPGPGAPRRGGELQQEAPKPRPGKESLGRGGVGWLPRSSRDPLRAYYAWLEYAHTGRWARAASALARRIAASAPPPLAVVSCGPPHMAHEGGRRAARALAAPFVMDLRDPWSLVQRLPESIASPVWYQLARRHERRAVAASALVITNTAPASLAMRAAYPDASGRIIAVMNGYDDDDPTPEPVPNARFTIAYAGAIYLDRDPRPLLRAAARVVGELALTPAEFAIEFMGTVQHFDGIPLEAIVAEEGLGGFVHLHPPGSRRAALEFLSRAHLLVSLPQDSDMAIPSKLFDYMRHPAWLLALAERGSATALLLEGTTADVVAPGDLEGIAAALKGRYRQYAGGGRPPRIADQRPDYSRRAQADRLFEAIERAVVLHRPGRP